MIFNRFLYYTYTPDLFELNKEWRDGQGRLWIMKKIRPTFPTRLINGGTQPCWKVYGKKR